ncbi:hypothetical protein F5887DRAFT_1073897 [Amanita rubescens]|nr:hypothetical protein F5887DRAFT_1073897 [Amanita rubescens]
MPPSKKRTLKSKAVVLESESLDESTMKASSPTVTKARRSKRKISQVSSDDIPLVDAVATPKKVKALNVKAATGDEKEKKALDVTPVLKLEDEEREIESKLSGVIELSDTNGDDPLPATAPVAPSTPKPKAAGKKSAGKAKEPVISDSDIAPSTPKPKPAVKGKAKAPVFSDSDVADSNGEDSEGMHSDYSLKQKSSPGKGDSVKKEKIIYLESLPDIPDTGSRRYKAIANDLFVMPCEAMDPALQGDYGSLPDLRNTNMIPARPFDQPATSDEVHEMLAYSKILENLKDSDSNSLRRLIAAVRFDHHAPFVNPSRALPSLVSRENNKLCLTETGFKGKPAVFLTTGLVVESFLQSETKGGINKDSNVRQIVLQPLSGEYERAVAFIGTTLEKTEFYCLLEDSCLFFSTRREGAVDNNYTTSTPVRSRSRKNLCASPTKVASGSGNSRPYFPASLGFKDSVPVYDARYAPDFAFRPNDLDQIKGLPLSTRAKPISHLIVT